MVANLETLNDDKSKFRQWDLKMVNALAQVRKSYGKGIERIKEFIDKGQDPEDARMGVTGERLSSTSGPTPQTWFALPPSATTRMLILTS